jgi:signal transduction histidine kinase
LRGVVREVRNTDADATVTVEVQDAACAVDVKAKRSAAERLLRTTPLAVVMAVRIVRAHGGDLDIAPPRRPGAALSIRLPLAPMEAREPLRTARVTRVR